jgi:hypothetical protein
MSTCAHPFPRYLRQMINILKLCVGADSVEDLLDWQRSQRPQWPDGKAIHVTRMWPRREAEVLEGSLYWVIKGVIQARQRILDLQEVNLGDGIPRCALVLDAEVIRTWRYLDPKDSPRDLPKGRAKDDPLPPKLAQALAELGLH